MRMCFGFFFFPVQTQWMAAQQTVMGTGSVWPDTATALLDSWVPTVPKVGNISPPIRPQLVTFPVLLIFF